MLLGPFVFPYEQDISETPRGNSFELGTTIHLDLIEFTKYIFGH